MRGRNCIRPEALVEPNQLRRVRNQRRPRKYGELLGVARDDGLMRPRNHRSRVFPLVCPSWIGDSTSSPDFQARKTSPSHKDLPVRACSECRHKMSPRLLRRRPSPLTQDSSLSSWSALESAGTNGINRSGTAQFLSFSGTIFHLTPKKQSGGGGILWVTTRSFPQPWTHHRHFHPSPIVGRVAKERAG